MPRGKKGGSIDRKEVRAGRKLVRVYYVVRRRYVVNGRQCEKKRITDTHSEALGKMREIEDEIADELTVKPVRPIERPFGELVDLYEERYLVPPVYVGGTKVAGMRSYKKQLAFVKPLVAYFGRAKLLKAISYSDLEDYKRIRLATPARKCRKIDCKKHEHGHQRSLGSVHREMQLLRAMLNVALRSKKWISENPFQAGKALINADDEVKRMRILAHEEERRLLEACGPRSIVYRRCGKSVEMFDDGSRRSHLKSAIILSIDTAARKGEEFDLRWRDWDRDGQIIVINSWISKTGQERIVPVTDRLRAELELLWEASKKDLDALIIPHRSVKRSFAGALRAAGITDYRWHDNRHTGTVYMLEAGIPGEKVMKITGHTQIKTFLRYLNINVETARTAAVMMNARRAMLDAQAQESDAVH